MALAERVELERLASLGDQRKLVRDGGHVEVGVAFGEIGNLDLFGPPRLCAAAFQQANAAIPHVISAEEIAAASDRPGHRRGVERQRLLDLVQQLEGVAALAVHLVDESDDGNIAST